MAPWYCLMCLLLKNCTLQNDILFNAHLQHSNILLLESIPFQSKSLFLSVQILVTADKFIMWDIKPTCLADEVVQLLTGMGQPGEAVSTGHPSTGARVNESEHLIPFIKNHWIPWHPEPPLAHQVPAKSMLHFAAQVWMYFRLYFYSLFEL